ncbi:MAG: alpha-amylase family glycosyl hydrolase, partial [Bacteroidales bacterium]
MKTRLLYLSFLALSIVGCQNKPAQKEEHTPVAAVTSQRVAPYVKNAVTYEVNIRQYTPEGTFAAFTKQLPRLKDLGVDILWIMPIQPISEKNRKGTLGSYYSIQDYRKINPEYGTMADFKAMVDEAHRLGFKVILDWVANHTGWDNELIEQHPDWYTHENGKIVSPVADWADVADLNYENKDMRRYMIESLRFWVEETGLDGFRCDMAAMVPTDFWEEARVSLDSIKPMYMLAEAWEPELSEKAFDAVYGWDLMHTMNAIAKGEKDASVLPAYFQKNDSLYQRHAFVMNFLTNHDENSWAGTTEERYDSLEKAFAVLTYTIPGIPMIYSGQEVGNDHRLSFFEKDSINWTDRKGLSAFYTLLNRLKKKHPALDGGEQGGSMQILKTNNDKQIFSYRREKGDDEVVVILNLSRQPARFLYERPLIGRWKNAFTGTPVSVTD